MKKLVSLMIAAMLILGGISVSAAVKQQNTEDIQSLLATLNIMNGYPDGGFYPELPVTRAEFSKISVAASAYRNMVSAGTSTSPFRDVPYTHWAAPYIKVASVYKLLSGYPDSTFLPKENVLLEEAVTVAVKLLGYSDSDFSTSWPYGQMGIAINIGLLDNIDLSMGQTMTRGDVSRLMYNVLCTKAKTGSAYYIETLNYKIVEDVTIIATAKEDLSVGADKVLTSEGTYKINKYFDYSFVGRKGDIILKDNSELVLFFEASQNSETYYVYSKVGDTIVLYKDGQISDVKLDTSLTLYYETKKSTIKSEQANISTGDVITIYKNDEGVYDYAVLLTNNLVGPYTVKGTGWITDLGINDNTIVNRDGKKVTKNDINVYDIAYYSKDMNMVWAYSKKVTGIYEIATPNKDSVTTVQVSGVTYTIESAAAMAALASGGSFELGDNVTLLLGKDGEIADVIDPANLNDIIYGYLVSYGNKEFTDINGNKITSYYVELAKPDGTVMEYLTKSKYDYLRCGIVRLNFNSGIASVSKANINKDIYGTFNYSKNTLGKYKLALGINILDVGTTEITDTGCFASVYPQRLDGVTLKEENILYYAKNSSGEITDLILDDVTGDTAQYGIITSVNGNSYNSMVYNASKTISNGKSKYLVSAGQPAEFPMSGTTISGIKGLTLLSKTIKSINQLYIETDAGKYPLSDKVIVYNSKYMTVPLVNILDNSNYRIEAYYDKLPESGGRIRVIKVFEK